ncbi:MAG TPA: Gfo/Idh/MocA family oxidoreductase [Anaerolineae bacterium]|nr:Gfo/Idh/MocA family oxidoreductase [Anaerolineae bacterium]
MNVCVVGYGMMGGWHSDALLGTDAVLHTLVGRRADATKEFAERYGYKKWTTSLDEALDDPEIEIVILANPSEQHAETAVASLAHGKHTLVEIPIAMSWLDSEAVVNAAHERSLTLGVVHPLRVRSEMVTLRERIQAGEEQLRQVCGRFYIHRLENVGATGYRRSWTDNLLWHHTTHLLDFALWMADQPVRHVHSFMPAPDPLTGTPMEVVLSIETVMDQSLVTTGSYYGRERIFETFVITNRDSYRLEVLSSTLTTGGGAQPILSEKENCMNLTRDFVNAVRERRAPAVPGESVLPAMRVLQQAQNAWDEIYGAHSIPGRMLKEPAR